MTWTGPTPVVSRDGTNCCGDNNCIRFIVTLHPNAEAIRFNIVSGAIPNGSLFWQLGCGGNRTMNERVCVSGVGPHSITFCKPGNNENGFSVTSISRPTVNAPSYISEGCTGQLRADGFEASSVTWRSIAPGAIGQYNSYLSCTSGCLTPNVTAGAGYPPYVDYEVTGIPAGGCSNVSVTRVTRVTFVTTKSVSITPSNPTVCFGGTATSITANPVGGAPPYTYTWVRTDNGSNAGNTQTIPVGVGTYTVTVGDQTNCPTVSATVTVTANPSPVDADAGGDKTSCANNPAIVMNGTVTMATGGVWSGGNGTYAPNTSTLNATYTPTAAEITNGTVVHTLTTTGTGGCPPVSRTLTQTIVPSPIVTIGGATTVCANNNAIALTSTVTNATGVQWTGGGGTFFPNNTALNVTYTPTAAQITAGSAAFTVTSTGNGTCNPVSANRTVTITAAPTVNSGGNVTVCANNRAIALGGSITLPATGGQWIGGTGTFNPNRTTLNATYTPSDAEAASGTVSLTLETTGNGNCNPVSATKTITITPAPVVSAGANRTVCANNASVVLAGTVSVPATGGQWIGGTGTFNPNRTTLNATYTPSAAEITAGTVTLTLQSTGHGNCNPVSSNMTITINAAPIVNAGGPATVCGNNAAVALNGSVTGATGGTWSGGAGTYNPNNNTPNATYTPSAGEISAGTVTLTLTSTGNGLCNPVSATKTITIEPAPVVTSGGNVSVCANNPTVVLNGTFANAGGATWTGGTGTFNPGRNVPSPTYTPSAAEITAGTVTLTISSTGHPLCNTVSANKTITITNSPIVSAGANQTICANNATAVLNGSVTVATGGSWTGGTGTFAPNRDVLNPTYTPSAAEITAGNVTLTLTSTGNGNCNAVSSNMIINITPAPTANAGANQTVCANNSNVTLAGAVTIATGGQWIGGTGTFNPNRNTLNATYTPSPAEVTAGSVGLTLQTTGNGNCTPVSSNMNVTITPAPTVNSGGNVSVCGNNAAVTLGGSVTVATGGTWTGGSGTFNPNRNVVSPTYTPSAAEISAGTVTLTLTTTGNGNCAPVSANKTITITPAPTVNPGSNQSLCSNNPNATLAGTVTIATGGTWSGGAGSWNPNNNSLTATYTPTAAEITAGSVTLTLTTTGNGNCNAVSAPLTLTFTPAPVMTISPNQTLCANNPAASLSGTVTVATGATWSGGGGTYSPNNNALNITYTPTAAEITSGSLTLTLTSTGNGNCNAVNRQTTLTFTNSPTVNSGGDVSVCANNATIGLNGSVTVATGGTWTGGSGTFNPNRNTVNATYTPTAAEISGGSVALTLTTTGNGNCNAVSANKTITITPSPVVNAGAPQTVCANNPVVTLNGTVTVATGGTWTGGTGTFNPNRNVLNPTYTPSAAEITAGTVTLTLTSTGNGNCTPVSSNITITITPSPTVDAGPDAFVCGNNPNTTLAGAVTVATGGQWTGMGGTFVPNANTLNATYIPSAAEINSGLSILELVTTGNGNCLAVRDTMYIVITAPPTVNPGADRNICVNNPAIALNATVTATGPVTNTWSGGAGTFNPNANTLNATYTPSPTEITNGTVTLTLTSNQAGCNPVSRNVLFTFTPAPTVSAGPNRTVCANNPATALTGSVTVATGGTWTGGTGTFNPNRNVLNPTYTPSAAEITAGTVTLTLTTTGNGNCNAVSSNMTITITPAPTANAGANQSVCFNNAAVNLNGSVTIATGGTWTSAGTGSFLPNASELNATYIPSDAERAAGTTTLTLTTTGNGNCLPVTSTMNVAITPAPTVNAGGAATVCGNNPSLALNGSVTVATGGFWSGGTGIFNPNRNTLNATYTPSAAEIMAGTVTLTLTTTGNGNCNQVSQDKTITITPAPTINAGSDMTLCGNVASVTLNGTVTVATGGTWTSSGTGSFSPNNLTGSYAPSAADRTPGNTITLTVTSTGNGNCLAVTDEMTITFTAEPTLSHAPTMSVCPNDFPVQLNATGSPSSWTGGTGTFNPGRNVLNPQYTPSAAEVSAGSVTLTVTTNPFGACPSLSRTVVITIPPTPVVSAGGNTTICGDVNSIALNGTVTNAGGGIWSTSGSGTFSPNNTTLNGTYNITAADRTAGTVTLTLTSTGNGSCSPVTSTRTITITPPPTVDPGLDRSVCADITGVPLNGVVTVASGGQWTTSGDGTFSPNNTTLNAMYNPGPNDRSSGSVTITLTSTGNGLCNAVSRSFVLTITPAPTANAGPNQTICADANSITLNGAVTIATGGTWSSTGSGTFSPNANTLNATYFPSNADRTSGGVTLRLTTTGNGTCNPVQSNMILTITPVPVVNAGPDVTSCADVTNVFLNAASVTIATGGTWTTSGSGTFSPNANTVNASYLPSATDKTSGIVTLTLTSTGNGTCNPVNDAMIINFTPAPTVNPGPNQTVCADVTNVSLNGTVTVATGGTWTTSGSGTFGNANSLTTNYVPSAADRTAGTVTLTLTSTGNGTCQPVSATKTITITPAPTVNAGANESVCADLASIPLNGTVTIATGGIWSTSGTGTFTPNATTLNASYVPSAADRTAGSVTLTLTTTGNGTCNPVSAQKVITITPAPTANAGADQTVCSNNPNVTLSGSVTIATGGTWSGGVGTFNASANDLNVTYTPTAGEITAGSLVLGLTTTGNGTCQPVTDYITINFSPAPTVNTGGDRTVCANNPNVSLAGSVTVATGGTWSGGAGTFAPNPNTLNAVYTPTAGEIAAGTATLTLTSTGNGTCLPVSANMTLTITPAPTANAGANQTVCADATGVALNGAVTIATGGTWTTSGSGTFSPNASALNATYVPSNGDRTAGNVTLTLTTTGNGSCLAVTSQTTLTITPAPTVNAGGTYSVCSNNANVALNGAVTIATGGTWSGGAGTFSPDANTLNATYTPTAAEIAAGSLTLTLTTTGNGTCNPVSNNAVILFTPSPVVNAGANRTICANNPSLTLAGTVTGAGGGTWTGGTGTFNPDANTLNAIYTPSAAEIAAGTVTLTLTSTSNGNCLPVTSNMTITITPAPTANAGSDQTVCANNANVALNGVVTVATGGTWSTSGTGNFNPSASTLNATYVPSNADRVNGGAVLTLTTTGNGNCNAVTSTINVTITPAPTISAGPNQTVCADLNQIPLNGAVTVASGATWTTTGSGTFNPDATTLNASYVPSAADRTNGNVVLTLSSTGNGNCLAVTSNTTITITPAPTVNAGPDQIVCADLNSGLLAGQVTVATGGTWTTSGTGSFSPNPNTLNANYVFSNDDRTAGTVTLTLTTTGNGTCQPISDQMVFTITPAPVVVAGNNVTVCADVNSVALTGASVTNATGGNWTTTGTGTFSPNANTIAATYVPSAADKASGFVTLRLTSTGNGTCNPVSSQRTLTITPVPTANAGPDQTMCANGGSVLLNGTVTIATGGTWSTASGTGTFTPDANTLQVTFTPSATQIANGLATITLTTTGNGTCQPVTSRTYVYINPVPVVNAGPNQTVCASVANVPLNGTVQNATGGAWTTSGTGSFTPNENTLNATYVPSPEDKMAGQINLTLTSTGNGPCNAVSHSMILRFTPIPTSNAGPAAMCSNTNGIQLNGTVTNATGAIWSTSGSGTFLPGANSLATSYRPSPADITAGNVNITLTTTGTGACPAASATIALTIRPQPTVNPGPDQVVCANVGQVALNGSFANANGIQWSSSGGGVFAPNNTTPVATYTMSAIDIANGGATLTMTTTGNGICAPVSAQMRLIITPAPVVNAGPDQTVCADIAGVTLNGSVTVATGGTWTSNGTGTFSPDENTLNATYIPSAADIAAGTRTLTLTSTGNGNCIPVSDQMNITITPAPTVNAGGSETICADAAGFGLNASFTVATGVMWGTNGSGTFSPDINSQAVIYTPSQTDISNGNVTLTVMTTGNGTCNPVTDNFILTITPAPTVFAGVGSGCSDQPSIALSGFYTVSSGATWSTSGTGTFDPDNTTMNASYIPSAADIAATQVTITLTTFGSGLCEEVSHSTVLNIVPAPRANAGPDQTLCADVGSVVLDGDIQNAGGGIWRTSGTGSFMPNNTTIDATYVPSAADTAARSVTLRLVTTGNNICSADSDMVVITFVPRPVVDAGQAVVCSNNPTLDLNGTIHNAGGGVWSSTGSGAFTPSTTNLTATYTLSDDDKTTGTIIITLTSTDNGICNAVTDQITLNVANSPQSIPGPPQSHCSDIDSFQLNGAYLNAGGAVWSSPTGGTFTPSNTAMDAFYHPTAADSANGSVTLTLTTTDNGLCNPVSETVVITLTPAPTIDAGSSSVCIATSPAPLNAVVTVAPGVKWTSTGTGTFGDDESFSTTYSPSGGDIIAGGFTINVVTTGNHGCKQYSDQIVFHITSPPNANAGANETICADRNQINLNGIVTGADGGIWTTNGTGTFAPDNTTLNATYNISNADKAAGSVTLTLTTTGNGICAAHSTNKVVTITPAPTANAGGNRSICADANSVAINGTLTIATQGIWTTTGTGTFSPDNTALSMTYNPSAQDRTNGGVTLTLTTTDHGICNAVSNSMQLTITPAPTVDAGPQSICTNNANIQLNGAVTVATGGQWSTLGSGSFAPNVNTLNAFYTFSAGDVTAGSVRLVLRSTGNGLCQPVRDTITINLVPPPFVSAGDDQTFCEDIGTVQLSGLVSGNATGGVWTTSGDGTFDDPTKLDAIYTPLGSDLPQNGPPTTVTLTLTSSGHEPCAAGSDQVSLTFTPAPIAVVNAGNDTTVCATSSEVPLDGQVLIADGGEWVSSGTGFFTPDAFTLNATYIFDANDIAAGEVTLVLRTTGNGLCNPVVDTMVVTITPLPTIEIGIDRIVCADTDGVPLTALLGTATGASWATSGTGIFTPDENQINVTYIPSVGDINDSIVIITAVSTGNGACSAANDMTRILISPAPTIHAGLDQIVCADNGPVDISGTVTVATGGQWSTLGDGSFANANDLNTQYTLSANDIAASGATLVLTTTGFGDCKPVTDTLLLTVTPAPTIDAGLAATICADADGVQLDANVTVASGGQWTTSGTGVFSPNDVTVDAYYTPSQADKDAGTVTLTIASTGNGNCNAVSDFTTITITPAPTVDAGAEQTVCADIASVQLNGSMTVSTTGLWTTSGSGTFDDATAFNAMYTPSAQDRSAGSVVLTLTSTDNGTCRTYSDQTRIIITPAPTVDAGFDRTVCGNNASVELSGSITVATGATWSGGNGTFSPDENTLNATYTPSAAEIAANSVTLTLTTTGNGTCMAVTDQVTINITNAPTVNAGLADTVCANNNAVVLNGNVTVATGGVWSGGSGTFTPSATGLNSTYYPSANDIAAGEVVLVLTSTGNGDCFAVTDTVEIIIDPAPIVDAGNDQSLCANNSQVVLSGNVTNAGGGSWTGGNGVFVNNNNDLNATYTPTAAEIASGSLIMTLTSTDNGRCNAVTDQMRISFTDGPTANAGPDRTVCANNATVVLNGSVTVASGGTWTGGNGTFSPNANSLTVTYTLSADEIAANGVTLTFETTGNGNCTPVSDQVSINVTPAPVVNAGIDRTVCANNPSLTLNGNITVATGGTWSGGAGNFAPGADFLSPQYTPSASEISAGSARLILTSTGNGSCLAVTDTMDITITPAPTVDAGVDQVLCSNNAAVTLAGVVTISGGGTWSGGLGTYNADANTLDATYTPTPSEIAAGSVNLTLTTTGNGLCNAVTDQMRISFTPSPTVNAGPDHTICANNASLILNGTITVAGGANWVGGNGTFTPSRNSLTATYIPSADEITAGTATITLTTTDNGNCLAVSDNVAITITPAPTADAGSDQVVCADTDGIAVNGQVTIATGGVWTSSGTGYFAPNSSTLNATYIPSADDRNGSSIGLTLTTTGNGNCIAVNSAMTVDVTPRPTVNAGPPVMVCADALGIPLNGSRTVASGVIWTTSGSGSFNPSPMAPNATYVPSDADKAAGNLILTITTTGNGQCKAYSANKLVMITPAPTVNAGIDQTVCANSSSVFLNGAVTVATGGTWTSSGTGHFVPNPNTLNARYVPSNADTMARTVTLTLTTTGNGNCNAYSDNLTVNFDPVPYVSTGGSTLCADVSGVVLNAEYRNALGVKWETSGSGQFFTSAYIQQPTYRPSAADIAAEKAIITLSSEGNASCNPVSTQMTLIITPLPVADAGEDQFICRHASTTLISNSEPNVTYEWWTLDGTRISPTGMVNVTAHRDTIFVLSATDVKGCTTFDSVTVFVVDPPTLNLPSHYCIARNLQINANPVPVPAFGTFQWLRNDTLLYAENNHTLTVRRTGIHVVEFSYGNCAVYDTTNVTPLPVLDGQDVIVCIGAPITISTTAIPNASYQWTHEGNAVGTNSHNLTVTVTEDETYYAAVTDYLGCTNIDTIEVTASQPPVKTLQDVAACIGDLVTLDGKPSNITSDDGEYQWFKNGEMYSTDRTITTRDPAVFTLIYNLGACFGYDTSRVIFNVLPVPENEDTVKTCLYLTEKASLDAGPAVGYLWYHNSSTSKDTYGYTYGYHYFDIINEFGCRTKDSIFIKEACPPTVYVPTGFNPNSNDPRDKVFKVFGLDFANFKITIFNRWGEIIFYSEDPDFEWDGTYGGKPMQEGVYNYLITYGSKYPEYAGSYKQEGTVTLLR